MRAEGGRLIVEPGLRHTRGREMLENVTPEAMGEAFDWGEDVGRERSMNEAYVPEAGDIIWTDFDPSTGREQGAEDRRW